MKVRIYFIFLLFNLGCTGQSLSSKEIKQKEIKPDEIKLEETRDAPQDSVILKKKVEEISIPSNLTLQKYVRTNRANTYQGVKRSISTSMEDAVLEKYSIDSLSSLFTQSLLHDVIPFWEGTAWSFDGHSSVPQQGQIACGYFVSTTLRDAGLNINRYKLAQQLPIHEAKTLAMGGEVKEFSEGTITKNISAMTDYLSEGIHFIGFSASHVGFVLKEEGRLYIIHSNYLEPVAVEIEAVEASEVFASYEAYYVVELSANSKFLKAWISREEVKVIVE